MIDQNSLTQVATCVNENRLWHRLMRLARIGATKNGGVTRLALTQEEIAARKLLIRWAHELDLSVFTDDIANLFFRLDGQAADAAPVMTGSHIDTQPKGGKFDGAFGVLAGLEALQAIREAGISTQRPIETVAWMNEEGSRFSPGMMGSEAFVGHRDLEQILAVTDSAGVTTAEALADLQSVFKDIPKRTLGFPVANFIEAHIEQGPILEAAKVPIGLVTGIQGSRRFRVSVAGDESHAGTEPMVQRKDALFSAIDMIQAMRQSFVETHKQVKFTTGLFNISPNAPSVVPSSCHFSIDLRHPDPEVLTRLGDMIPIICEHQSGLCTVRVTEIANAASLEFPPDIRNLLAKCTDLLGLSHLPIFSLAGHDARQLHYHCPTAMVFVPCHKGLSHNEAESCQPADLAAGTRVLAASLAALAT